jgi:O-antigen/teichoic acid export membrane protein
MSSFHRNVFKLAGGSVLGQLVVLAAMPLLAKMYSPAQFGLAQAAMSWLTLILIVGALRLEVAVLNVPDSELGELFKCAWWLTLFTSGATFLCAIAVSAFANRWSADQRLVTLLVPVLGLFACRNQLMSYFGLRIHAFGPSSRAKVVQSAGYGAAALGIGVFKPASAALLVADMAGRAAASAYLAKTVGLGSERFRFPGWLVIGATLARHRELVGFGLVAALVNAAGSAFTAAMLLWLFGAAEAGQYAMVERLVGMPVGLLSASVSQVYMANLSRAISKRDLGRARRDFRRVVGIQSLTGIPGALLLYFAAPLALDILLGSAWKTAGQYAQALTLLYLCSYVAGPFNMTLTVLGRQRLQLLWDCFRLAIVAAVWWVIHKASLAPVPALWLYSISAAIAYVIYLLVADLALRQPRTSGGAVA